MRISHIEHHLIQQIELSELISRSYDNFIQNGSSAVTPQRVHTRVSVLKDDWERFAIVHKAISHAITQLTSDDRLIIQENTYFTNSIYSVTHERYVESLEKLYSCLESDQEILPRSRSSTSLSLTPSNAPAFFHHVRLPRIDLPKFSGTPSDWLSFRDLFNSLVLENPTLTPVEKLQYLKTSLTGSAALLLKNTPLSADNFQRSWDSLLSFYENKRILVNAALSSLLSLKRMTKESATELEKLYTTVLQIYCTLESLQRPVFTWDDFLIFITVQQLDSESVKA